MFGNSPSFTALNMKNKKPLDTVLLEVRYQFTWTYANNSQPHTEQRTLLIGRNHIYSRNEALYQNDSVATSLIAKGAKRVSLYSNPTIPYEVWTNIQAKTVEIGYRVPFDNIIISFIQPANELQWSFFEDEKQKRIVENDNGYDKIFTPHQTSATFSTKQNNNTVDKDSNKESDDLDKQQYDKDYNDKVRK